MNIIPVSTYPADIVFDPVDHNMYVTNFSSDRISVITSTANLVIANIPGGDGPVGVIYNSSNQHLYVSNFCSNTVTVIHP